MDEIIIYGAGNMGQAVLELLQDRCEIRCFLDGNPKLKGIFIQSVPVYHPSEAASCQELLGMTVLVAMTACPFSVMRKKLMDMGFLHILPAGDYVSEKYTSYTILNTWKCEKAIATPSFSDEKSVHDYKAACGWFGNRMDQEFELAKNKYFPDFLQEKIANCRVMLDTAALDGEYIGSFLRRSPESAVYAFTLTPSSAALEDLRSQFKGRAVELFPWEAAEQDGMDNRRRIGLMRPFTRTKTYRVQTKKIDTVMENISFDFLRCYSMSESLPILRGGRISIQKYRPVIAVNISHYQSDFETVLPYLETMCPDYKFYFRLHSYQGNDGILYAVPKER